jgi:hypothetical protein
MVAKVHKLPSPTILAKITIDSLPPKIGLGLCTRLCVLCQHLEDMQVQPSPEGLKQCLGDVIPSLRHPA